MRFYEEVAVMDLADLLECDFYEREKKEREGERERERERENEREEWREKERGNT